MQYKFPEHFWGGAATSGPQSEGRFNKAHRNIFDYWYDTDPDAFFDKVGPNVASNFYNSFREDIDLMKQVGLNSVRTSIQWSRLIKDFETGEVDADAVRFYNEVIDEFIAKGIRPIMNLVHFDIPVELLHHSGGRSSQKLGYACVSFARTCY